MTFAQRLDETAQLVEGRLTELIDALGASGAEEGAPQRLAAAIRHAVLSGGKRLRPFLVLESARLFGVGHEWALDPAAAVECVHCYSLVHDDLPAMDNDELRRGLPTVWKAFDEWTAVLAGDALLTLAFEILARQARGDRTVNIDLISGLARAAGASGMVGGQALDLEAEKLEAQSTPTASHVRRLQRMKTGALIAFSCEAGAIIGVAGNEARRALRTYGEALGLAFQIADDLLDAEGDATTVGKRVAKDAAAGKATLVSLIGPERAREELARLEAEASSALAPFGPAATPLRQAAEFVIQRKH